MFGGFKKTELRIRFVFFDPSIILYAIDRAFASRWLGLNLIARAGVQSLDDVPPGLPRHRMPSAFVDCQRDW